MRLLSLNVWGGQLLEPLLKYLWNSQADILCLQEVFNSNTVGMTANMFGAIPRACTNLFEVLQRTLPDHDGYFFPSCEKFPHDPAFGEVRVPYGIATFVRKEIPIVRQYVNFVHGAFQALPRGEPPLPRVAHAFTVWDRCRGEEIAVAHMHGLWTKDGKGDNAARDMQTIRFRALLKALERSAPRKIACGDWNVLPTSNTFRTLHDLVPIELITLHGYEGTRTSHYKKTPRYADYMCISPEVDVTEFEVVYNPEVSDHCPLLLDFE